MNSSIDKLKMILYEEAKNCHQCRQFSPKDLDYLSLSKTDNIATNNWAPLQFLDEGSLYLHNLSKIVDSTAFKGCLRSPRSELLTIELIAYKKYIKGCVVSS